MKVSFLFKYTMLIVLAISSIGCSGSDGSVSSVGSDVSDTQSSNSTLTTESTTVKLNEVEQRVVTTDINDTMRASMNATVADIQEKLENAAFQATSGFTTSSTSNDSQYHLADVIFTIGTDDLSSVEPNTLEVNAAYNYFKTYVVDAGRISDEDAIQFRLMSISEFNEDFVAGYYEAASKKIDADDFQASLAAPMSTLPLYGAGIAYSGVQSGFNPQFFGFFKFFNPMTYMGFMMKFVEAVITAALAQAFKMMLMSGTMTKWMLQLALRFPILTNVMIHVLSSNWGITRQMIPYLKYDTEFGELFMQLAYEQSNMAHFVFQNIDAPLYYGMSVAMTRSIETTERMAIMMNWYSEIYFIFPQPATRYNNFVRLLMNTGMPIEADGETNHGDGNELANEKLYFSIFSSSLATQNFIAAMKKIDPMMLTGLMDHIFLGQQRDPATGEIAIDDATQGTYNIYAIAQGMLGGMEKEGFGPYIQNLMDFAMIIPQERYMQYAQVFAMAGYSYYAQSLPEGSSQPTMEDFMQFLMGTISEQLGGVDPEYGESAQAFGQMLQSLQPYIDEFMQNGMVNMDASSVENIVPDITEVSGNINDPITEPLEGNVPNPPAPSSLIDIIHNFPLLWEKDYSNEAYKGEVLSRYNNAKVWETMSDDLSNLHWMLIPSSAQFIYSSRFDFIFENGTIDMYIISNNSIYWNFEGFSLVATGETVSVRDETFDRLDDFQPYRVYKVTIPAGTSLGNLHILMQNADGIAFDITNSQEEYIAPVIEEPQTEVPPVVSEPVNEDNSTVEPVVPPVVVAPQVINIVDVFSGFDAYTQKDYSSDEYKNGLVQNAWRNAEKWTSMPDWLSNIKWIEINQNQYISSSAKFNFDFTSGSTDMYLISTKSNLPWLLNMEGELIYVEATVKSSYGDNMNFYVFKRTMQAGETIDGIWSMMNHISGIAFDTASVTK